MAKYYIIAGERSGDLHASNLVKELRKKDPNAVIRGIGGDYLQEAGAGLFFHYSEISYMGFWEVLVNILSLRNYINRTKKDILNYAPDVLVLVDFAGYNMRMAAFAKQNNIRTVYYISPKIWAWNTSRAYKIKRIVDKMLCILPFETDFYKNYGVEAEYVGNPVMDALAQFTPAPDFSSKNNLNEKPVIAILPGSRRQEVTQMLGIMLQLKPLFPQYQMVVAGVDNLPQEVYDSVKSADIPVLYNSTYEILSHAQLAVVTSGTATLETALLNVPQVVCYKTSGISYQIAKALIKVKYISLVNLIAGKEVVKELIQADYTTDKLRAECEQLLHNKTYRTKVLEEYQQLKNILGNRNASENAAIQIVDFLNNT